MNEKAEYETEFTLETGERTKAYDGWYFITGQDTEEITALIGAALAYVDARGPQRTTAEIALKDAVKALRRAAAMRSHAQ